MSGKAVLGLVTGSAVVVVIAVHYQQVSERRRMRLGVERDLERLAAKKNKPPQQ